MLMEYFIFKKGFSINVEIRNIPGYPFVSLVNLLNVHHSQFSQSFMSLINLSLNSIILKRGTFSFKVNRLRWFKRQTKVLACIHGSYGHVVGRMTTATL